MTMYRCDACGNKTRFDVEEEEILSRTVDKVVCRWCDRSDAVVEIQLDR